MKGDHSCFCGHDHEPGAVTKKCTKCGRIFPADRAHFSRDARNKDGLRRWCKECDAKYRASPQAKAAQAKHRASPKRRSFWR